MRHRGKGQVIEEIRVRKIISQRNERRGEVRKYMFADAICKEDWEESLSKQIEGETQTWEPRR